MLTNFKILLSAVVLFNFVLPLFSFQPSGGVLPLDGEDDYAILPLTKHDYILPRNTDEFTVEVWFYPKAEANPEPGELNVVLSQQVRFGLLPDNKCRGKLDEKDQVCSYGAAYLEGAAVHGIRSIDAVIKKDQWNYIAVIFTDSTFYFVHNDQIANGGKVERMNVVAAELRVRKEFKSFFVGAYAEKDYFHGEIDAIRFSDIARYDLPAEVGTSPFEPPHRFSSDRHTLALWNFNDKEGADRFKDESGNGYTLIGMNGATTSGPLAVNPRNTSITTTWGQIKSGSF